jgi:hypothetical protein
MRLEVPAEQRGMVQQTLQTYGLVLAGHQAPEAWLTDPAHAQQLRHLLTVAENAVWPAPPPQPLSEQPGPLLPPVTAEFRHLCQLVGNALYDL